MAQGIVITHAMNHQAQKKSGFMTDSKIRVVVTPPSFCKSEILREELSRSFPGTVFSDKSDRLNEQELIAFCQKADAAIIGRDPVTEHVLKSLPNLKFIAKYGVGVDNIDQEALQRHNVGMGWTAGVNRRSVAELTLCFMLGLCHHAFQGGHKLRNNIWEKDGGNQLTEKTIGIIGCGNIGMEMVRLLAYFNCQVLVRDIADKSEFCKETGATETSLDDLIQHSDIISLHVPLTELTENMVNSAFISKMKSTAYLINTSRGKVVDQSALKKALQGNVIKGAALDVFEKEPPTDKELLTCLNLMATPHIGGTAAEAVEALGRATISHLIKFSKR